MTIINKISGFMGRCVGKAMKLHRIDSNAFEKLIFTLDYLIFVKGGI